MYAHEIIRRCGVIIGHYANPREQSRVTIYTRRELSPARRKKRIANRTCRE